MTGQTSSRKRAAGAVVVLALAAGAAWWVPSAGAEETAGPTGAAPARAVEGYTVSTSTSQVGLGDTVTLTVSAADAEDLYAYDLGVAFDPSVVDYVEDSARTDLTGSTYATTGPGRVEVLHTKLGTSPAANGPVTLATLTFDAVGTGAVTLTVDGLTTVDTARAEQAVGALGSAPVTVVGRPAPAALQLPAVTGAARVGETLAVGPGTWDVAGLAFGYQWLRDGVPIPGAVLTTHRLTPKDANRSITAQVTATQADRATAVATSNSVGPVDRAAVRLRVRVGGATEPGDRPRVRIRTISPGLVARGRFVVRYDGRDVSSRATRDGRQTVRLPARRVGDHRLAVVYEPAPGFSREREVRTVRIRR